MTERERRSLIWGGAVILSAMLALKVIPGFVDGVRTLRTTTMEQLVLRARAQALLDSRDRTRDSLRRAFGAIVALAPRLVQGTSGPEAQASLAAMLSHLAGRHALRLLRTDPLADSSVGVFSRASLHAELEGDIRGVTGLLRALEAGDPLLTIGSLTVSASEAPLAPQPEALRVEMRVSGYYLPRGAR